MKTDNLTPPPEDAMTPSWDLLRPSLKLALANWELILYLFLLPSLVYALGYLLIGDISHIHNLRDVTGRQKLGAVIIGVGALWSLVNLAPALYFRLSVTGRKSVTLSDCYRRGLPFLWRLLLLNALIILMVMGGLLLFIVPGFIFLRRYYLASYYLIDENLGILEALRRASHDTKPVSGYVWGILGVEVVFSIVASGLGALPIIGIILGAVIGYVTLFLPALRYREIIKAVVAD